MDLSLLVKFLVTVKMVCLIVCSSMKSAYASSQVSKIFYYLPCNIKRQILNNILFKEQATSIYGKAGFLMCIVADWHSGELCPCPRCITALLDNHGEVILLSTTTASLSEKYG